MLLNSQGICLLKTLKSTQQNNSTDFFFQVLPEQYTRVHASKSLRDENAGKRAQ